MNNSVFRQLYVQKTIQCLSELQSMFMNYIFYKLKHKSLGRALQLLEGRWVFCRGAQKYNTLDCSRPSQRLITNLKPLYFSTQAQEVPEDVLWSKRDVEPDLSLEGLVTINETGEDTKEKGSDKSSASKQTPREGREGHSADVSSPKPSKTSSPFLTTSGVVVPTGSCSEPQTKPSSSVRGSGTSSSAAAVRTPGQEDEPTEGAVRTSDHKGSAESSAAKTVESKVEKFSETDPEEKLELIHQTQKLETEEEEEEDGKGTKESGDTKDQILDEDSDEQRNRGERRGTQTSGPEKDQVPHQGGLLVSEGADGDETCRQTTTSVKVTDASHQQRVKDGGSNVKPDQTATSQTEDGGTGRDKMTDEIVSVGDKSVLSMPLRRSPRGARNTRETTRDNETTRAEKTEKDSEERDEGETRRTPGRKGQEDVTPTKTTEDTSEPKQKLPEDIQEAEEDKEAATSRRRGRPRKTRQTPGETSRTCVC